MNRSRAKNNNLPARLSKNPSGTFGGPQPSEHSSEPTVHIAEFGGTEEGISPVGF